MSQSEEKKEENVMDWEAIGAISEIVGAIAVIVTLLYLAVQIRQGNKQQRQQSYQAWVAANVDLNSAILDPSLTKMFEAGMTDPSKLTQEEHIPYAMWHMSVMQMVQTLDYMYRAGSLDKELWESELNRAALILTLPGARQWWDAGGKTQLTPKFVQLIESIDPKSSAWFFEEGRGFVPFADVSNKK